MESELTRAEIQLKRFNRLFAWVYLISGLYFLFLGSFLLRSLNALSKVIMPSAPLYDASEGYFWLALAFSMMMMLAYISLLVSRDVRKNLEMTRIIILSKFCSSFLYIFLFVTKGQLAYLAGFFTDAPLFVIYVILYHNIVKKHLVFNSYEQNILKDIGDTIIPRGGAFEVGFSDVADEAMKKLEHMVSFYPKLSRLGLKLMVHEYNLLPPFIIFKFKTFRGLSPEDRLRYIEKWEHSRFWLNRMSVIVFKSILFVPFYGTKEAEQAIGYERHCFDKHHT